jgi:hypothetical protein
MHREDKRELLATATQIERQARRLLAGDHTAPEMARLQKIVVLARYMREHLEMLRESGEVVEKARSAV